MQPTLEEKHLPVLIRTDIIVEQSSIDFIGHKEFALLYTMVTGLMRLTIKMVFVAIIKLKILMTPDQPET
jgi:hypothetical protein